MKNERFVILTKLRMTDTCKIILNVKYIHVIEEVGNNCTAIDFISPDKSFEVIKVKESVQEIFSLL